MNNEKNLEKIAKKIETKLLNMNFNTLLGVIREINGYDYTLEEYELYNNDSYFFNHIFIGDGDVISVVRATQYGDYKYTDEYVSLNGYDKLDSYNTSQAKKLIYDDIEYISEVITEDFITEKNYNLFFYDEL